MSCEELALDPAFRPPPGSIKTHEYVLTFLKCLQDNPSILSRMRLMHSPVAIKCILESKEDIMRIQSRK